MQPGAIIGKAEKVDDEEPQWESAIVDSSNSPDDLDVLSISDGSDVERGRDREQMSNAATLHGEGAGLSIDDSADTIFPQPFAEAVVSGETYVVADDFLDVEVIDEILEVADNPVQSADDEIDPGLQSFLKGF